MHSMCYWCKILYFYRSAVVLHIGLVKCLDLRWLTFSVQLCTGLIYLFFFLWLFYLIYGERKPKEQYIDWINNYKLLSNINMAAIFLKHCSSPILCTQISAAVMRGLHNAVLKDDNFRALNEETQALVIGVVHTTVLEISAWLRAIKVPTAFHIPDTVSLDRQAEKVLVWVRLKPRSHEGASAQGMYAWPALIDG